MGILVHRSAFSSPSERGCVLAVQLLVIGCLVGWRKPRLAVPVAVLLVAWSLTELPAGLVAWTAALVAGGAVLVGNVVDDWPWPRPRPWTTAMILALVVGTVVLSPDNLRPTGVPVVVIDVMTRIRPFALAGVAACLLTWLFVRSTDAIGTRGLLRSWEVRTREALTGWRSSSGAAVERRHRPRPDHLRPVLAGLAGLAGGFFVLYLISDAPLHRLPMAWVVMDSHSFIDMARVGPHLDAAEWPFFNVEKLPGYPLLIRLVHGVVPSWDASAILISIVGLFASLLLLERWLVLFGERRRVRLAAFAVLCSYPFGFFLFGIAYSESLFLALALGCAVLVEFDRPLPAGLVAGAAVLVRPSGLALVVLLLAVAAEKAAASGDGRVRASMPWIGAAALSMVGLAAYIGFCWWYFGDPFVFVHAQREIAGGHGEVWLPSTWVLTDLYWWVPLDSWPTMVLRLGQVGALIGVVASTGSVRRLYGIRYAAFVMALVALTVGSTVTTDSLGRYFTAAFPVAGVLGAAVVRHPRLGVPTLVVCATVSGVLAAEFLGGMALVR